MKRLFCFFCALVLTVSIMGVAVNADDNTGGADKIYTLFSMDGGFIVENPYDRSQATGNPWLMVGADVFMAESNDYPARFNNEGDKASFYYVVGSNSLEWLRGSYKDCLSDDYVFEMVLDYDEESEGYAAVTFAYNHEKYIEVYIAPDGRGDIAIDIGEHDISMLDAKSILNREDPSKLIMALSGEDGKLPERLAVSVKVTLNDERMPDKIDVYVNGLFVATTGAGFAESVRNLTPKYDMVADDIFPKDKLGNIVALKFDCGARGEILSAFVYSLDMSNKEPLNDSVKYYSEIYGNSSFVEKTENEEPIISEPGAEVQTEEAPLDNNIIVVIWMIGIACGVLVVLMLIILSLRKKYI